MKEERMCQNCKQEFIIEDEDFQFYKRIDVPTPTWCPKCSIVKKMTWRNERSLYWRNCNLCGKKTLSMYVKEDLFSVYCHECWISDKWDPLAYGIGYSFEKSFFEQFKELEKKVPRAAVLQYGTSVNCDFTNYTRNTKNVYLAYSVSTGENVFYSFTIDWSKDVSDSLMLKNSELIYEGFNSDHCYNSKFLIDCRDCRESSYLYDCVNCENCFMSVNLRNKQFVFRGKQYLKDEYIKIISEINDGSYKILCKLREEFRRLVTSTVHKYADIVKTVNCTGNYLSNCKNVFDSYSVYDSENVRFTIRALKAKDIGRVFSCGEGSELIYEGIVGGKGSSNIKFFANADTLRESQYTDWCSNSHHLFACIGLRNKQYCILNKRYTKEEYEVLLPKIKQHMMDVPYVDQNGRVYRYGEFFPPELSPFAYNETIAQEYFPLIKEEVLSQGFRWKDPNIKDYTPTILPKNLPDSINDVPDSITTEVIGCMHEGSCTHQCTTAFKIIPEELAFYRRMNLPLPRLCPNCRHYERLAQRNPLKLWHRKCHCGGKQSENGVYTNTIKHSHGDTPCPNEFETSYSPDRKEIVYCESCYQAEVV
ncbi:MAG: hypothetical protein WC916_07895 [Candidatus Woesearchaeota archaeon]